MLWIFNLLLFIRKVRLIELQFAIHLLRVIYQRQIHWNAFIFSIIFWFSWVVLLHSHFETRTICFFVHALISYVSQFIQIVPMLWRIHFFGLTFYLFLIFKINRVKMQLKWMHFTFECLYRVGYEQTNERTFITSVFIASAVFIGNCIFSCIYLSHLCVLRYSFTHSKK